MILDHSIIASRYFFPQKISFKNPLMVRTKDVSLACHSSKPFNDAYTLVYFHGNGEVVADYVPEFANAFTNLGLNIFFSEYRGFGESTGEPLLISMLNEIDAIFQATECEASKMIVYGRSVGSIYAIEMIHRYSEIAGLILESSVADPLERILMRVTPNEIGCSLSDMEKEADLFLNHKKKLQQYSRPVLIMHSKNDSLVSVSNAGRTALWTKGRAKLCIFEQGDHNTMWSINGMEILREVNRFHLSLKAHESGGTS